MEVVVLMFKDLKPYEDSQPKRVSMFNKSIERIPHIVNPATGEITDEFQTFYNAIVDSVLNLTWHNLYAISDKFLPSSDFISLISAVIGPVWDKLLLTKPEGRGIDIELNLGRFESTHRNIVGGFYVNAYRLEESKNDLNEYSGTSFKQYRTELLFTYRDGSFQIITCFQPFVEVE